MGKVQLDLSIQENAEKSRNKSALVAVCILNTVLALAYMLEVIKGSQSLIQYLPTLALCVVPTVVSVIVYCVNKASKLLRYVSGIGFCGLYTYIMFTTTSDLCFCYMIVFLVVVIIYADLKFSAGISGFAILVNIGVIVKDAVTVGLTPEEIANAEIVIACLVLTGLFCGISVSKITMINKANMDKSQEEKIQTKVLLDKTLDATNSINRNILEACVEADVLKDAISATQHAMENLTEGTNDAAIAISNQQKSTEEINKYVLEVERSTKRIVKEVNETEDMLLSGNAAMTSLLEQVKVSEDASSLVAKEMAELQEYADKMQNILGLIRDISNQTGLLALNASIEAARAGEAGKGFAVVASEISSLSAQTETATDDINVLIENIATSLGEVTEAVESLIHCNERQNEYVADSADNFSKIRKSTQEIINEVDGLQRSVDAVSSANQSVIESIENVSSLTEEVTAGAVETLESCYQNQVSIEKVAEIMELLGDETEKLQQ